MVTHVFNPNTQEAEAGRQGKEVERGEQRGERQKGRRTVGGNVV